MDNKLINIADFYYPRRLAARLFAVQACYQQQLYKVEQPASNNFQTIMQLNQVDYNLATRADGKLFDKIITSWQENDEAIIKQLDKLVTKQPQLIVKSILIISLAEFLAEDSPPRGVLIEEYQALTNAFASEAEAMFVSYAINNYK